MSLVFSLASLSFKRIKVEVEQSCAIVSIDTGHKANAFCLETMAELITVAGLFNDADEIKTVILKGNENLFTGGMDLSHPVVSDPRSCALPELRKAARLGATMCNIWENIDAITVSAIEGFCVGAGVALSLALDFRVCTNNTVLYVPEIERGMNMSWQSVPRSVNLIGPAKTKRMFILAEKVSGEHAFGWGWADYLAKDGDSLVTAKTIAANVASKPPLAVSLCKQAINKASNALNDAVSYMDTEQFVLMQHSEDYAEGIQSYLQKREPSYTGK